ncbi:hypothetical protein AB0H00_29595 [Nocardia sp. NPDC023852]|uniref:hypothetical protein n=1 Tax=Nocardia sp. NPDC023852 TaxID=3154697 RepID=UPI0033DD5BCA
MSRQAREGVLRSGIGHMVGAFLAVLAVGVLVMLLVTVAFPSHEEGSTRVTPRPLGPCEPFCSLRTTTATPGGAR